MQRGLGFVVDALAHHDHAAQILRFGEVRLTRVNRVEFFQRFRKIIRVEGSKSFVIHCFEFRFRGGNVVRCQGTEHQHCDRRDFPDLHASSNKTFSEAPLQA